jgi:hypothetical protein
MNQSQEFLRDNPAETLPNRQQGRRTSHTPPVRRAAVVVVLLAIAAAGGYALGRNAKPKPSASHGFAARSSYYGVDPGVSGHMWIRAGATDDAPGWGAVLFTEYDQAYTGTGTPLPVTANPPLLLTAPHRTGPLRIVDHSPKRAAFLLRSSRGWLYALDWESNSSVPTLYELGPRLDPAHLPRLARQGLAVPMTYAEHNRWHEATVLVGLDDSYGTIRAGTVYGYLEGYALPRPTSRSALLERPLLGPDRALYRIDPGARRLARVAAPRPGRRPWQSYPSLRTGCSSWPAANVIYRACAASVVRIGRDGARTLVLRDRGCTGTCRRQQAWGPILPSPDGRTLLAVHRGLVCGYDTTYLVPSRGGRRIPALAGGSDAVGWLGPSSAVIVSSGGGDCLDRANGALYLLDRTSGGTEPVIQTNGYDATAW